MKKVWHFLAKVKMNAVKKGGKDITLPTLDSLPIRLFLDEKKSKKLKLNFLEARLYLTENHVLLAGKTYNLKIAVLDWNSVEKGLNTNDSFNFISTSIGYDYQLGCITLTKKNPNKKRQE